MNLLGTSRSTAEAQNNEDDESINKGSLLTVEDTTSEDGTSQGSKSPDLKSSTSQFENAERGRRLEVPSYGNRVLRVQSPDTLSELSFDNTLVAGARGRPLLSLPQPNARHASKSPAPPTTFKSRIEASWTRNKGLALVLLAQVFGTLMNVTTRLLEVEGNNGKGMHPFQILFARMGITVLLSSLYMWYREIPDFPFGAKQVRVLLLARGFCGFFGVFGMYCELSAASVSVRNIG
jgi:hypothetical protein